MTSFWFKSALLESGWADDVLIEVDQTGVIVDIKTECRTNGESGNGIAIPGMINVHSHAFQRAFAGLSEYRTSEGDSFWTWRRLMYDFLQKLSPADCYAIARHLFVEMLKAGYTHVGEFHYVHNSQGGARYTNIAEMADAVVRAACDAGIGICMLPVLYQRGGFDDSEPDAAQQRFCLSVDELMEIAQGVSDDWQDNVNVSVGIAPHSLRACSMDRISELTTEFERRHPGRPIHIHVAEQTKEVEDCIAANGATPVEYLMDHQEVDQRWCLIHATHMTESEHRRVAENGAVVGLCPATEANLGDGIFATESHLAMKGKIAIGSDSHICVDLRGELRLIENSVRLTTRRRAVLCDESESVGRFLYSQACRGGAQALGLSAGQMAVGSRADIIVLDSLHPNMAARRYDRWLDSFVFCESGDSPVSDTMVAGKWVIKDRSHISQDDALREYRQSLARCLT
ncbi:formimidoylglutamate deiminase [Vicingaceae bacterium]|nr:formimidoylglutamate deiminase [Vicingaceae bacterium]